MGRIGRNYRIQYDKRLIEIRNLLILRMNKGV